MNYWVGKIWNQMKKRIILFILLFSSVGITWADGGAPIPENVNDLPVWFLVPPENEYVGVSLPLKDFNLAQSQAIYTAFLSYIIQHNMEGSLAILEEGQKMYSTQLDTTYYNSNFLRNSKLFFSCPALNYQIARIAKNQHGEVFVSIKVTSYNADSQIRFILDDGYYLKEYVKQKVDGHYNSKTVNDGNQMNFALQDSLVFEIKGNIAVKNNSIDSKETHHEEKIEIAIFDSQNRKKETCSMDESLNYQYPKTKMKPDWNPSYVSKSHTLQQSLGAAYLTILLNLLSDKDNWTEEKQESQKENLTANIITYAKRNKTQIVFLNITDNELFVISKI